VPLVPAVPLRSVPGGARCPAPARHADQAIHKLLSIGGVALPQDLLQFGLQGGTVGQRGGCVAGEGQAVQDGRPARGRQVRQNSLPLAEQ
jgi:hypothetical protein